MTEEIKEKLDLFKYCVEKNEYLEVSNMKEWKPLLNYITNLQKEKDNYKQRNENAVEYIGQNIYEITARFDGGKQLKNGELDDLLNILQGGDE